MANLPERSEDRSLLRASDADRDRVGDLLSDALAEGRLDQVEYAERLDALHVAKTFGELEALTRDLPTPYATAPAPRPSSKHPLVETAGATEQPERMIGIFGGGERKGRWRVRRLTNLIAIFGGFKLDMREATLEAPVVELRVFTMFGGFEVVVPDGVDVRSEAGAMFGGIQSEGGRDVRPGSPVVLVKGFALFGGGSVRPRNEQE